MAILTRVRSAAIAAVCFATLAWHVPVRAAQRTATAEDDIKAAFLLNFTKFVEWPAAAPAGGFRVCALAEPAFEAALTRTLSGESTGGRPIAPVTPESPEAARACHILFVSRADTPRIERWLPALRGLPVLIVGETKAAADAGAHITFVVEDNRVKFDVDDDAATRAGLKISSKLLRVARRVTSRSTHQ